MKLKLTALCRWTEVVLDYLSNYADNAMVKQRNQSRKHLAPRMLADVEHCRWFKDGRTCSSSGAQAFPERFTQTVQ